MRYWWLTWAMLQLFMHVLLLPIITLLVLLCLRFINDQQCLSDRHYVIYIFVGATFASGIWRFLDLSGDSGNAYHNSKEWCQRSQIENLLVKEQYCEYKRYRWEMLSFALRVIISLIFTTTLSDLTHELTIEVPANDTSDHQHHYEWPWSMYSIIIVPLKFCLFVTCFLMVLLDHITFLFTFTCSIYKEWNSAQAKRIGKCKSENCDEERCKICENDRCEKHCKEHCEIRCKCCCSRTCKFRHCRNKYNVIFLVLYGFRLFFMAAFISIRLSTFAFNALPNDIVRVLMSFLSNGFWLLLIPLVVGYYAYQDNDKLKVSEFKTDMCKHLFLLCTFCIVFVCIIPAAMFVVYAHESSSLHIRTLIILITLLGVFVLIAFVWSGKYCVRSVYTWVCKKAPNNEVSIELQHLVEDA